MATHMQMLGDMPMLQEVYTLLSQGIIKNNKGLTADE
jgi:hypothetical protein